MAVHLLHPPLAASGLGSRLARVSDPNLNALWCRAIAEELVRAGVGHVVLCPGSRNSPLLHALQVQFAATRLSHIDERSAGFVALGLARAGDQRVAVCVTSGSALANLLPAVVEADAAGLALIVISADRPWELNACGAPQAMAQHGIFAPFVRQSLALGEPTATTPTLRALRAQVSRLAQRDDGPVHLNVPLRDPLPPLPDPAWQEPELGPAPLARSLYEWLGRHDCPWISCEDGRNRDFLARATIAVHGRWEAHLDDLAQRCAPGDAAWSARWQAAEAAARHRLREAMAVEPWNEVLAAHRAVNHQGFAFVHLASSMSVRHGNLHLLPGERSRAVFANRGVNGIDGTLGTFLGELAGRHTPGLLLIGDLAFLHDLPALALANQPWRRGAIVVLNNDGGGIFDFLAVAKMPEYQTLVRTPHGLDFAGAARQFGLVHTLVEDAVALAVALDQAAGGAGLHLIECQVQDRDAVERHRRLIRLLAAPIEATPA